MPTHPLHSAVLLFELPVENNKHPNFERGGGGRGVDCFYVSPISCRRLYQVASTKSFNKVEVGKHSDGLGKAMYLTSILYNLEFPTYFCY